ncbi:MAG: hypothetical protein COV52_08565 [Gammaproteobacteria bacterium CG11_big_fil_rev_8_21_14_0_20_46_22]|nr:MAG: hypothetical protein COW05_01035 [Gammaproteobacteria bacterium CG12_big_fil_rev_8_21_14_0_65_46_12]PIR10545.1 MAG: hypothetical protein COV52_08565 [Gammaproteobacteria bacterium CG11_big_fil_rev_8_21_14_0_20_46_22]
MKSQLNKVSKQIAKLLQNSRTRIVVLIVVVIAIIAVVVGVYRLSERAVGDSGTQVAGVPDNIQSVPTAGKESEEYMKTLLTSNQQAASQALKSGTSDIPTLLPSQSQSQGADLQSSPVKSGACCCCQQSAEQKPGMNNVLNGLESTGAITTDTAKDLRKLAQQNVSDDDFSNRLKQMVASGQLTKAQADALLSAYKRDNAQAHKNASNVIDSLVASGAVDAEEASQLRALTNSQLSPSQYAAKLNGLVREGKLSANAAQELMGAYQRQYDAKAATETPNDVVNQLAKSGELSASTASQLKALDAKNLTPGEYATDLNKLVSNGELSPAAAQRLLAAYNRQATGLSATGLTPAGTIASMQNSGAISADTAAKLRELASSSPNAKDFEAGLDKLVKSGDLTPSEAEQLMGSYKAQQNAVSAQNMPSPGDLSKQMEAAGQITAATESKLQGLNTSDVSPAAYRAALDGMVANGELTKAQADRLAQSYRAHHLATKNNSDAALISQLEANGALPPSAASQLQSMVKSKVSPSEYASALKSLVASGQVSPAVAARLLQNYVDTHLDAAKKGGIEGVEAAQAQQALQQDIDNFNQQAADDQAKANEETQKQIQAIEGEMRGQAKSLIAAWKPKEQQRVGGAEIKAAAVGSSASSADSTASSASGSQGNDQNGAVAQSMIKAGSILFAVLDTAVNSDRPGPVMATIVAGKYKGAKLLGSLQITPDQERVILSFNSMSMKQWPQSVGIQSVAINPDTAQTAIASAVDHHYLLRYSALFASSFMQGYSNAVMNSGSTTTNSIFGGSTSQHGTFSPGDKIAVGLGQVGTNLSGAAQQEFNKPPTVTVQSGVGLGVLFTSDVPKPTFSNDESGDTSAQNANVSDVDVSKSLPDLKQSSPNAEGVK